MIKIHTFFLLLFLTTNCLGQELTVSLNTQKAFTKGTRDKSGLPGNAYWQNSGNYTIKVNFNPSTLQLKGSVAIDYTNNSKDTLKSLVLKLYPNFYKSGTIRNMPVLPQDLGTGVTISYLTVNGLADDNTKRVIKGTTMYLKDSRVLPGQKVHLDIGYEYTLNKSSFVRTGQVDTGAFVVAYFFPRVAVYDDIDGWDEYPYAGKEEFYNDYGDFRVQITVPANYQVWATGDLKNMQEVYNAEIRQRIQQATISDSIIDIITQNDLHKGVLTTTDSASTWRFEAANVTDFAFAISNHYVWKASGIMVDSFTKRRTRVDAVFNPDHPQYLPVAAYARKTVGLISYVFPKVPFPYSHETVFEGLDAMEYPMLVNNLPFKDPKDIIEFTAHEVFHSLFPFYVANSETKHSFMDEGLATLSEFMFHPLIDPNVPLNYDISPVNQSAGTDEDMPIITPTPQLYGKARFADKDLKPALAYLYLQEMLGKPLFVKSLQHYITVWAGKHPTPSDFFNSLNTGSGINLNWFWKNWFFEKNVPDLAITKVTRQHLNYAIVVTRKGSLAVPVHLTIFYKNGTTETITKDISCWAKGNRMVIIKFKAKMEIKKMVAGNAFDVDINPGNNTWEL